MIENPKNYTIKITVELLEQTSYRPSGIFPTLRVPCIIKAAHAEHLMTLDSWTPEHAAERFDEINLVLEHEYPSLESNR